MLDTTFPAQHAALKAEYDASLANIPGGLWKLFGVEAGKTAAAAMLKQGHDARAVIPCSFGSFVPGVWQPLADATGAPLCDPSAWVKDAAPFLVNSASDFRTAGPYPLGSAAYAADYNEVKELGSLNSATRTPLQSHLAAFWQSNPASNYNLLAQRFVAEKSLDTTDSARLFAMIDLTAADAIITAWSDKYARLFWRPMAAIRHGGDDGNPATVGDPTWTPLFNPSLPVAVGGVGPALITPPYPDNPSGAVSYASATMHAFQSFFGTDDETFYVTSSRFPGSSCRSTASRLSSTRLSRRGSGPGSISGTLTFRRQISVARSRPGPTRTTSHPTVDGSTWERPPRPFPRPARPPLTEAVQHRAG